MRKIFWCLFATGFFLGCAGTPKKDAPQKTVASSYTKEVKSATVENASRIDCPRSEKGFKVARWKDTVAMANSCFERKDFVMLEKIGRHLCQTDSQSPWGPYFLSLKAEATKESDKSIWFINLALKKAPESGLFHYQLARLLWAGQDKTTAVKMFETAVSLDDELTPAHEFLGVLYFKEGEFSVAEKHFEKVLKIDVTSYLANVGLSEVEMARKNMAQAAKYLERAIEKSPSDLALRLRLAEIQETDLKQVELALSSYKKIKRLHGEGRVKGHLPSDMDKTIGKLEVAVKTESAKREISMVSPEKEKVKK